MAVTTGYSRDQIRLHWIVVALIGLQYFTYGFAAETMEARAAGASGVAPLVALHVFGGLALFVLVAWRLGLRVFRGVPAPVLQGPAAIVRATRLTHAALYAVLVAMPLAGAIAWLSGADGVAGAHAWLWNALVVLTLAHLALSGLRWATLRDTPLARMRTPEA